MLATLVDDLEASDVEVRAANPAVDAETGDVVAELTVAIPNGVEVGGEDDEATTSEVEPPASETDRIACSYDDCEASFETERGMKIHVARVHLPGAETEDDDGPPYRNPSVLRRVYDPEATFEEMTKALGVDVSPATVRRYMIKYGIHDPDSYSPDRATDESTTIDVDGLGNGLTVDDVRDAVLEASTLFDVERRLDLQHDEALDLLRELDLLELVHGRMADRPDPTTLQAEVDRRLHRLGDA